MRREEQGQVRMMRVLIRLNILEGHRLKKGEEIPILFWNTLSENQKLFFTSY